MVIAVADWSPLIERAFTIDAVEHRDVPLEIEGTLPAHLTGTCFFNGPGRFERAGLRYRHWLDGDGMVCALTLERGEARLTNRFVRSEKFVREEEAGRPIFRTFGTSFPGDALKRGVGLESPVSPVSGPNVIIDSGSEFEPFETMFWQGSKMAFGTDA